MTPFTFKEFCIKANTEVASKYRKYYIKLEYMFMKYLEHNLKQTRGQLDTAQSKVKALENELRKFKGRQRIKFEFGDTVYIIMEGNIFKIGSALNMNFREDSYYCHSNLSKVVYTKRCRNRKVLEDAMHNRFITNRYNNRKDWFIGVSFETLRKAMDEIQFSIDGEISTFTINVEALNDTSNNAIFYQLPEYQINDEVEKIAESNDDNYTSEPSIQNINEPIFTNPEEITKYQIPTSELLPNIDNSHSNESSSTSEPTSTIESSTTSEKLQTTITSINPETNIADLPDIPPDFDGFIRECFVLKEDAKTSWVDIGAKYRIWSRSLGQVKDALYEYLKQHTFKETFMYNEHTKTNSIAFQGLEMIPLKPFQISENSTEIEKFVYDTCVNNVTGRVASKDIYEKFVEWKHESDKKYTKLHKNDKLKLSGFFNNRYLAATVHNGERIRFGYYGISLKGSEDVGTKPKRRNRKIINMIHPHTKEVVRTFESITHASKELGVTISAVSIAISNKKICKGYFFEVAA